MKILVGISGGVDSAGAALKLVRDGHQVECAILKMHEYTALDGARSVAKSLGLPLHEIDMQDSFGRIVKENLIEEYTQGRTPNPCIICNERVKFRGLYDFAAEHGFDKIATGHYAKIVYVNGRYSVASAADLKKDQSYMLYRLPEEILSALVLPLCEERKENVRALAACAGLSAADAKDSQEICFLPNNDYPAFIEGVRGVFPPGSFVDPYGKLLGMHRGIIRYTVGQRKGLGISLGERMFVTDITPESNTVTLSPSMPGAEQIIISDIVYSGMASDDDPDKYDLTVKLRYSAAKIRVHAELLSDGKALLKFDSPAIAAPGQSAVIYDGDRVLFGGFIKHGN